MTRDELQARAHALVDQAFAELRSGANAYAEIARLCVLEAVDGAVEGTERRCAEEAGLVKPTPQTKP